MRDRSCNHTLLQCKTRPDECPMNAAPDMNGYGTAIVSGSVLFASECGVT